MYQCSEDDTKLSFQLSSDSQLVDRVVAQARAFLSAHGTQHHAEFDVVLRELLINAIEHGNRNRIELRVACTIAHLGGPRWQITVADQGQGFDHRAVGKDMPAGDAPRRRGLALVHGFSDQVEFNDPGNEVTAFLTIITPTAIEVSRRSGRAVVCPTGDLSSTCAEAFRRELLNLAEAGEREVCIDLEKVQDVDSVSLSVLIAFAAMLKRDGRPYRIELVHCQPDLANLFRLTNVERDFSITLVG